MTSLAAMLDRVIDRAEHSEALDPWAERIAPLIDKAVPPGPVRDAATGTPLAHPSHPMVVLAPIGCWTGASLVDLVGGRSGAVAARRLIGLGILGAVPAVVSGGVDWVTTSGAERRVGLVHATANATALTLYTASWLARRRGRRVRGTLLSLVGAGFLTVGGWLGGHLAYALGVGVDTTAFEHFPQEWTDAVAEAAVSDGSPVGAEVAGVPVVIIRHNGELVAFADRCTHRGGPLHEGKLVDGCVQCPWHGSQFALPDGQVAGGPASRPAPRFDVRVVDGTVQLRRADEPRTLRTNPVGV